MGTCSGAWQCHQASGRRRCSAGIDSRCRSVGGAAATILTRPPNQLRKQKHEWIHDGLRRGIEAAEARLPRPRRRLEARPETFLRMEKLFHRFPSRNVDSLAAALGRHSSPAARRTFLFFLPSFWRSPSTGAHRYLHTMWDFVMTSKPPRMT